MAPKGVVLSFLFLFFLHNEGLPAARREPVLLLGRRSPEAAGAGRPSADEALWI